MSRPDPWEPGEFRAKWGHLYMPTVCTHGVSLDETCKQCAQPDRNMVGAREFIDAILMGKPLWPNEWGQDVAAAAYFIHRQRTDVAEPEAVIEAAKRVLNELAIYGGDDDRPSFAADLALLANAALRGSWE